jgi:hypothetical protein
MTPIIIAESLEIIVAPFSTGSVCAPDAQPYCTPLVTGFATTRSGVAARAWREC